MDFRCIVRVLRLEFGGRGFAGVVLEGTRKRRGDRGLFWFWVDILVFVVVVLGRGIVWVFRGKCIWEFFGRV